MFCGNTALQRTRINETTDRNFTPRPRGAQRSFFYCTYVNRKQQRKCSREMKPSSVGRKVSRSKTVCTAVLWQKQANHRASNTGKGKHIATTAYLGNGLIKNSTMSDTSDRKQNDRLTHLRSIFTAIQALKKQRKISWVRRRATQVSSNQLQLCGVQRERGGNRVTFVCGFEYDGGKLGRATPKKK